MILEYPLVLHPHRTNEVSMQAIRYMNVVYFNPMLPLSYSGPVVCVFEPCT